MNSCDDYLTQDEFKYLAPLCVNEETIVKVIEAIPDIRLGKISIDSVISEIIFGKKNYVEAKQIFISKKHKTSDHIMGAGMNRDGIKHDADYVKLYFVLKKIYVDKISFAAVREELLAATKAVKTSFLWRKMLFTDTRKCDELALNRFDTAANLEDFDKIFFEALHLYKAKSMLSDYMDLNRRYLSITDSITFEDSKVAFTPLFLSYFKTKANGFFDKAFTNDTNKTRNLALQEIDSRLAFEQEAIVKDFGERHNAKIDDLDEMYDYVEQDRYSKFKKLIDKQFTNNVIIEVLTKMETRASDNEIIKMFGGEADVPTIFEYIVGVAWYRISGYHGKILDYMKLSLTTELLPRTHAGGGESDIVYKYSATDKYPAHDLLIECTLMTGTTQRHGEMEPVSRHLMNHMLDNNINTYCVFITNKLHNLVVSDFRARKSAHMFRDDEKYIESMNIVPCDTEMLRTILTKNLAYDTLYHIFMNAYSSNENNPLLWLKEQVRRPIQQA